MPSPPPRPTHPALSSPLPPPSPDAPLAPAPPSPRLSQPTKTKAVPPPLPLPSFASPHPVARVFAADESPRSPLRPAPSPASPGRVRFRNHSFTITPGNPLLPAHVAHKFSKGQRATREKNESLNAFYALPPRMGSIREPAGEDASVFFRRPSPEEQETTVLTPLRAVIGAPVGLDATVRDGAASPLPTALRTPPPKKKEKTSPGSPGSSPGSIGGELPGLVWTRRDKLTYCAIVLACIGSLVTILVWVGPAMKVMDAEFVRNAHEMRYNEQPGIVFGLNGVVGGSVTTQSTTAESGGVNKVAREILVADSAAIFDLRLIAGISENQPVLTHAPSRGRKARVLKARQQIARAVAASADRNPQQLTIQIAYMSSSSASPVLCLAAPPTITTFNDEETELLATVAATAITSSGLCPALDAAPASATASYEWEVTSTSSTPIGVVFQVLTLPPWAAYRVLIAGLLLISVFVFIALDVIHRTLVAMVGSCISLTLLGALGEFKSLQQVVVFIDEQTLSLLFGMMVMVYLLSTTGVFEWIAIRVLVKSRGNVKMLLVMLSLSTGGMSFFLDNTSVMLLTAPVTIELCKVLDVPPVPFLISEVMFSNIGGTSTMIGDPPNIILGSILSQYISFVDFIVSQAPAILVMTPVVMYFLTWYYRETLNVPRKELGDVSVLMKQYPITQPMMLVKAGTIMATVLLLFFLSAIHGISTAWIAILGAIGMMIVASPHDLHGVFEKVRSEAERSE